MTRSTGRTGGATVNVTVKSGTNRYSGSVTYVQGLGALVQNSYQNKLNGIPQAKLYERSPGWTFGGPVRLPGYDGRNKTFFFYSGEFLDQRDSRDGERQRAITSLERAGDFSQSFTPNQIAAGANVIYDPLTRLAFPNNRIPAAGSSPGCGRTISCMDPVAAAFLGFAPEPNAATDPTTLFNFIPPDNGEGDHYHTNLVRVDQNFANGLRAAARYGYNWRAENRVHQGRTVQAIPDVFNIRQNATFGLDLTWSMGPSMVSSVKVGYSQHLATLSMYPGDHWDKSDTPWDNARLGLSAPYLALIPRTDYFHPITVSDYSGVAVGNGGGQVSDDATWTVSQQTTKLWGRHTLKFGGQFGVNHYWVTSTGYDGSASVGAYNFTRNFTSNAPGTVGTLPVAAGGNALASFLIGYPASQTITLGTGKLNYDASYFGLYLQDDWRLNDRLTVNLGLRYDYERPVSQQQQLVADGFDFTALNPLVCPACPAAAQRPDIAANRPDSGAGLATLRGGLTFADGLITDGDRNNIGPRVGVVYKVTDRTVLRGGYGLSFQNTIGTRGVSVGTTRANAYVPSQDGGLTPRANLAETRAPLYPSGLEGPAGTSGGLLTNVGQTVAPLSRRIRTPEFHQYSIELQRELPWRSIATAAYVGSRTLELPLDEAFNSLTPAQLALGDAFLNQQVPNPFAGLLPGTTFNTPTIQRRQLLRPYPEFNNITIAGNIPDGRQWYHSAQFTWQKRLSHGAAANVAYTYAHAFEEIDPLNAGEPRYVTRRGGAAGRRHALRINPTWNAPALASQNRWVRWTLGGWQLGLSYSWVSGIPINMPANVDVIGTIKLDNQTFGRWFNTCTIGLDGSRNACADPGSDNRPRDPGRAPLEPAFKVRPANALVTTGPRIDEVPNHRVPYIDARFEKVFKHGRIQSSIAVDMYNMFGLVQFGNPVTSIANFSTFGEVPENQNNDTRIVLLNFRLRF